MAEALLFQLNPRLQAVASYVRKGKKIVDVGTDHAYLPIWLIKSGCCPHAVATELREGPIMRAARNAYRYRVQNKLSLRQCDGLSGVEPEEADDISIAGMGGELIARILRDAPWVKASEKRLILQPMASADELRRYLCENGFSIEEECTVRDHGRVYAVLSARYSGHVTHPKPLYLYVGNRTTRTAEEADYLRQQQRHLKNVFAGCLAKGEAVQAEQVKRLLDELEKLLEG